MPPINGGPPTHPHTHTHTPAHPPTHPPSTRYALWQGTCHLGFPVGEFSDELAKFKTETEV